MCIYICASACSACETCLRNLVCIYIYSRICIYTYVSMHIYTGWRRLIGSLKLQIIFHRRATKYRSLLQKINYKDKRCRDRENMRYGVAKTHRIPYVADHFPQKSH